MSISLPSSSDEQGAFQGKEPFTDRILRKSKEQPLVPLGMLMTCGALFFAARAVRSGDSRLANRMFYWRVGLQGFTLVALVAGGYMVHNKIDQDELKRQKAKEREQMWIEELERIDSESKDRQKRAQSIQEAFVQRREDAKREAEGKK